MDVMTEAARLAGIPGCPATRKGLARLFLPAFLGLALWLCAAVAGG